MKSKNDVEKWMRCQGMSGVATERIKKLMNEFATPDSFFDAKKVDIEKAYKKITPLNRHGIGKKFWDTFDKVRRFWKEKDVEKEEKSDVVKTEEPFDTKLVRLIPYRVLKAVVDMMELLDVEAINLMEIVGFLESVRFRQKKDEPKDAQQEKKDDAKGCEDGERK